LPTKKDWEMKQKMILIRNYENGKWRSKMPLHTLKIDDES
jgi:hypothetical protein